jgi:hypothetical protein
VGVFNLRNDDNMEFLLYKPANHTARAFEIGKGSTSRVGRATVLKGGQGKHYTRVIAVGDVYHDGHADFILEDAITRTLKIRYLKVATTTGFSDPILVQAPNGMAVGLAYLKAPENMDAYVIYESPDGIAPREYLRIVNPEMVSRGQITFDQPYRAWPIVAIVP